MFFHLQSPSPIISWAISKNPQGIPFVRSLSSSKDDLRTVEGKFINELEYHISVKNDGLKFLSVMREQNRESYVSAERYIVCPYNLQGFSEVFKSALRGTNDTKGSISDDELFVPLHLKAKIGPFPVKCKISAFSNAGILATWENFPTENVGILNLETTNPLSICNFLRRIYIISTALTSGYDWNNTDLNKIDRYIALGEGWLDQHLDKKYLISKLAGKKQEFKEYLTEELEEKQTAIEDLTINKDENEHVISIGEKSKEKINLHSLRHQIICDLITKICPLYGIRISNDDIIEHDVDLNGPLRILDLGSGEGKLLQNILKISSEIFVTALECNLSQIYKIEKQFSKRNGHRDNPCEERYSLVHENILFPRNIEDLRNNKIIILSEVIEHFNNKDRQRLLILVRDILSPDHIILTTPNYESNEEMWSNNDFKGFGKEGYRHNDHKIEYSSLEFYNEVVKFLDKKYNIEFISFDSHLQIQPSFIIKCSLKERKIAENFPAHFTRIHESIYFPQIDLELKSKEIRWGLTSNAFVQNSNNLFWMGGTIAPCDYSEKAPEYLEHPNGIFDYYLNKGVIRLIEEPKWMGSRASIAAFKNIESARQFGFDSEIIINTRGGFSFFKTEEEKEFEKKIYSELSKVLKDNNYDFIMLDGEMLPWSFKGEELIRNKFVKPGEAALIYRTYCGDTENNILNVSNFLKELGNYSAKTEVKFKPFHLLAVGNLNQYEICDDHYSQAMLLDHYFGKNSDNIIQFNSDDFNIINLNDEISKNESIKRWEEFTNSGGEGFVYKTKNFTEYFPSGRPICPMMKCRGRNYLRLIYGIDYLEKEYFSKLLKNRSKNVKRKRELSVHEHLIAISLLQSTLNRNWVEKLRYAAAFLGYDGHSYKNIDSTL